MNNFLSVYGSGSKLVINFKTCYYRLIFIKKKINYNKMYNILFPWKYI